MSERIIIVLICGVLLVVALLALSHRYSMNGHFLYDRITGDVRYCYKEECAPVAKP